MTLTFNVNAQSDSIQMSMQDSIAVLHTDLLNELVILQKKEVLSNRYKMYPTQHLYIKLKLDTQTGRIEQVQWSYVDKEEFITTINSTDLSSEYNMNSFELYPTQNMYQFILFDKATGRTWHVKWGFFDIDRWIRPIY